MPLTRFELNNVRNLKRVKIIPAKSFNLIYGKNGSGKTSLLEAIYVLSLGRSFRTLINHKLISFGQNSCSVFGKVAKNSNTSLENDLGVQKSTQTKTQVRINGVQAKSASLLAEYLPLQLIAPQSIELIDGSSKNRRQFVDWGVFHVEHQFIDQWRLVQRQVKQRNALLKSIAHEKSTDLKLNLQKEIFTWDKLLVSSSNAVNCARISYLDEFIPYLQDYIKIFLPDYQLDIEYYPGWPKKNDLASLLESSFEKDLKQGYTFYSPNRADIRLKAGGVTVTDVLSRGQLKLLVCSLKLAQARHLAEKNGLQSIFLVDDLASELDPENRQLLCSSLHDLGAQVFITSVDKDSIISCLPNQLYSLFHVEQGVFADC